MDNRTGKIAVYSYDPATRDVRPRVFGDIATLFTPAPTEKLAADELADAR